jgi:rhodanese-related sulfurtransferase
VKSYRSILWLSVALFVAACGENGPDAKQSAVGGNAATGGSDAAGGITAFGGATNNPNPSTVLGGTNSAGGSPSLTGGATQSSGVPATGGAQATGGSSGCGGTLTLGSISPAQLHDELAQGTHTFLLINVHVPVAGHIPGTDAEIDHRDIAAIEQFIGTDKRRPTVIYCMSDYMSSIAGPTLVGDGYCNVRALSGGMSAWKSAGYTVDP